MALLSWLGNWKALGKRNRCGQSRGGSRRSATRCRPTLEALEDRLCLSALAYSTYLGGSAIDGANAVAADSAGNAYVTGYQQQGLSGNRVAFVAKFNADGSLAYEKTLGGNYDTFGDSIAVDGSGNAYVLGSTTSANIPTLNGFQSAYGGGTSDYFLAKLDHNGSLLYSTYLGGSGYEGSSSYSVVIGAIAVDNSGNAYVTGNTGSTNFPITGHAFQKTEGSLGGFVCKIDTNRTGAASLVYSTFLGGARAPHGIAVDSAGAAYITGQGSGAFPTTPGAFLTTAPASSFSFVTKLSANGSALVYSTYLGSCISTGGGHGIAVDGSGNAYVAGNGSVPATPGAYQTTSNGSAFVTELNGAGSGLIYSTYFGKSTQANAIALDGAGHIFVTGSAGSVPIRNAFQPVAGGQADAFVAELDPSRSGDASLLFSSFLGGSGMDYAFGIAVDGAGGLYVVGQTYSKDFPTANPYQATNQGTPDPFVTKILLP
jgi:hypothetical protein